VAFRDGVPLGSGPLGQLKSKLRASGDLPLSDALLR
jgi:hypothetical protein